MEVQVKSAKTPTAPLPKTSDNASTSLVNLVNNLPTTKPLNITTSSNRKSSRINRNTSQRKLDEVEKKPLAIILLMIKRSPTE